MMAMNPFAAAAVVACVATKAMAGACGCDDVVDLRNRICEAQAAINEYGKQIQHIKAQEAATQKAVPYSVAAYGSEVQPCVQEAINQVTNGEAHRPSADTDNACETTFKGNPTACLKETLTAHENVHVQVCKAWQLMKDEEYFGFGGLFGQFQSFRDSMSLVDMLNEERDAYGIEISHAYDQLRQMAQAGLCPGLWAPPGAPPRMGSLVTCPPPRDRPPPDKSRCKHR